MFNSSQNFFWGQYLLSIEGYEWFLKYQDVL